MASLIADREVTREDYRVSDLFAFDKYAEKIKGKLNQTRDVTMVALVGRYGSGKSVLLEKLHKQIDSNDRWVHIDAWKYPERRNLWEGFILDFAKQLNEEAYNSARLKIFGGKPGASKKATTTANLIKAVSPSGANDLINQIANYMDVEAAKSIDEVQQLLGSLIDSSGSSHIYIVVEDADRSGEAGIYFIETLQHYLNELMPDIKITVFVPIANKTYENEVIRDSLDKCIDIFEFFEPINLEPTAFLEKALAHPIFSSDNAFGQMHSLFTELLRQGRTIRELKQILRQSNASYVELLNMKFKPDPRIVLCIQAARYLESDHRNGTIYSRLIKSTTELDISSSMLLRLLIAISKDFDYDHVKLLDKGGDLPNPWKHFDLTDDHVTSHITKTDLPIENPNRGGHFQFPRYYLRG